MHSYSEGRLHMQWQASTRPGSRDLIAWIIRCCSRRSEYRRKATVDVRDRVETRRAISKWTNIDDKNIYWNKFVSCNRASKPRSKPRVMSARCDLPVVFLNFHVHAWSAKHRMNVAGIEKYLLISLPTWTTVPMAPYLFGRTIMAILSQKRFALGNIPSQKNSNLFSRFFERRWLCSRVLTHRL